MSLLRAYLESKQLLPTDALTSISRRQSIYGGSFDTNLLELQLLEPHVVDEALEQACGLPAVPPSLLEEDNKRPWDAVPSDATEPGMVVPLRKDDDRLLVATHPDLPNSQLGLLYRTVKGFTPMVTAECCLAALNAQRVGQSVGGRYAALVKGYRDALLTHRVPEPEPNETPADSTTDAGPMAKLEQTLERLRDPSRPVPKPPPLWVTLAKQLSRSRTRLAMARDTKSATAALVRAALIIAPRVGLFAVKKEGLRVLEAPGSALRLRRREVIPLAAYGRLERAVLGDVMLDRTSSLTLRQCLDQPHPIPCIFLPIRVHSRPVLVLYLDREGQPFAKAERDAARDLCDVAEKTLDEVLRVLHRRAARAAEDSPTVSAIRRVAVVDLTQQLNGASAAGLPIPTNAASVSSAEIPEDLRERLPHERSVTPPSDDLETTQPILVMPRELTRPPEPEASTSNILPSVVLPSLSASAESAHVPSLIKPKAPTTPAANAEPDSSPAAIDQAIRDYLDGQAPITRLRDLGEPALAEIANRFPGPLAFNSININNLRKPSEHGALLQACVELGPAITPYLLELMDHGKVQIRFYAVYLYQELRDPRCIQVLGERAFDADENVRVVAMRVLETYARAQGYGRTLHKIRRALTSSNRKRQLQAIRALGTVRDVLAVPTLIDLLETRDPYLQEVALEALCSITGQQLGFKARRWRDWHNAHGHEHRAEWLMSQLRHRDVAVRRWCAEELARITGASIPFRADADRRTREKAIERWYEWWRDNHKRFLETIR
ncbi:MAG: HEAT repeat domain-containing protein [Myxococcales bacterium]|nr:HEAT repeat domain-containing protein [Myxococcales bacterium]MCB9752489.1 HEAT repeat domain-containing protein [Myxococcales bacterium]